MARGRMINKGVSLSLKFGALVNDATRLLATWTIPHLDKRGVFHGDPQIVKSLVFPLRQDLNAQEVAAMLDDMESVGLIRRFAEGGRVWQVWPGFADNQRGLHAERESTDYPAPPDVLGDSPAKLRQLPDLVQQLPAKLRQLPDLSGKSGPEVEVEEEVQREREVEEEGAPAASGPDDFEDAPAIRVHRDVCGYVPMSTEQKRQIIAGVNGCAETTWRDNLAFWMAEGYRADSIDKQLDRHEKEAKRAIARTMRPATNATARGRSVTHPQIADPSAAERAASEQRARQQRAERAARKAAMQEVTR